MINLKEQLHEGCTVHFRCGGSVVVGCSVNESEGFIRVYFEGIDRYSLYSENGFLIENKNHPFDIVKIDPKPFDWKDVKQKMAFKDESDYTYYYIADDFSDDKYVVVSEDADCAHLHSIMKNTLTRYEEGDLK